MLIGCLPYRAFAINRGLLVHDGILHNRTISDLDAS